MFFLESLFHQTWHLFFLQIVAYIIQWLYILNSLKLLLLYLYLFLKTNKQTNKKLSIVSLSPAIFILFSLFPTSSLCFFLLLGKKCIEYSCNCLSFQDISGFFSCLRSMTQGKWNKTPYKIFRYTKIFNFSIMFTIIVWANV